MENRGKVADCTSPSKCAENKLQGGWCPRGGDPQTRWTKVKGAIRLKEESQSPIGLG